MSEELRYQSGFGNEFATEAVAGGLPQGQNAPQKHPLGLYTEQMQRKPLHRTARCESPHMDVSHSSFRDAQALPGDSRQT